MSLRQNRFVSVVFVLFGMSLLSWLSACSKSPLSTPAVEPEVLSQPAQGQPPAEGRQVLETLRLAQDSDFDFSPEGPIPDADLGQYYVVIGASVGGRDLDEMAFGLWPDKAPITVRNFLRLASSGFYDGLTFHRVLRDFMIQGGCAKGNGLGQSPLGMIPAEFSSDPDRDHRYGVLSMARSNGQPNTAGSQFFVINDESRASMGLNGEYASFGRLTQGVASLEALSDTPVVQNPNSGEPSKPVERLVMRYVRVLKGSAPSGETIERPMAAPLDLGGEPERVHLKMMLIGFKGSRTRATRTQAEAKELAQDLFERLEKGEDFDTLAAEFSDDSQQVSLAGQADIFSRRLLNTGVRDRDSDVRVVAITKDGQSRATNLQAQQLAGTITMDEFRVAIQNLQKEMRGELLRQVWMGRNQLGTGESAMNQAFQMEVGQTALVDHDRASNPNGWMLLRRVE